LTAVCLNQMPVQSPMPAALMSERKTITPLNRWVHFGIKALVKDNLASLQPDCPKDVRTRSESTARNP